MNRTIWKFALDASQRIDMPKGAKILKVAINDEGGIAVWAEVDPHAPVVRRAFVVRGTGWAFSTEKQAVYIDTVFSGDLVWHVFDLGEIKGMLP